jgi:CheY-like chemotaxis protein
LKILLAEDNKINAKVTTLFLSKMGHISKVAENGEEVMRILEKESFDVILMDLEMPVVSGIDATEMIRNGECEHIPKDIPIIAMTAHTEDEIKDLYPDIEVDGYLTKPLDKNKLAEILHSVSPSLP